MFTSANHKSIERSTNSPQPVKAGPFFQPKRTVNTPGDAHEQEADRVADQVMRMKEGDAPVVQRKPLTPVTGLQRKCAECEKEEKEQVQRKELIQRQEAPSESQPAPSPGSWNGRLGRFPLRPPSASLLLTPPSSLLASNALSRPDPFRLTPPGANSMEIDWLAINNELALRGALHLRDGIRGSVAQQWQQGFQQYRLFGLSPNLAARAMNLSISTAVGSAISRDHPSLSETFERGLPPGGFRIPNIPLLSGTFDLGSRRSTGSSFGQTLWRKETSGSTPATAPSIVSSVLSSGGGQPMDGGTRQFMESRFGQDFGQVRIHTGGQAAESAAAIQARAYTSGRDVVFGAGEYQPGSEAGKRLLAHELVHIGQQNGVQRMIQRVASHESPALEDVQYGEQQDGQAPTVQRTAALNQSTPTNHDPRITYPWGPPAPGGYNYFVTTDAGTPITAWVALDRTEQLRYWCHGHTLGTYRRWLYSVYSGTSMQKVIQDEYRPVLPADVQNGDIAVWPTFGHSAIFQTVVKNNGVLDEAQTLVSTKNGQAPLAVMSLDQVKTVYASLGGNVGYYRHR